MYPSDGIRQLWAEDMGIGVMAAEWMLRVFGF